MKHFDSIGGEINEHESIMNHIIDRVFLLENSVLEKIAEELLGRKPVPEDSKRFTNGVPIGIQDYYWIAFDEKVIGKVTKGFKDGKYFVEFNPL